MKKIFLILVLLLSTYNLYSQWGIKAGLNYSTITDSPQSKYKFSGHFGGTYDFKLSEKWYVQPELLFSSIGCNLKDDGFVLKRGHINIYALELPVNMSFRPNICDNAKLILDFGLYVRYGLFGNKTYEYYDLPKVNDSPFDAFNRFDTGFNLGIGINVKQYLGILTFQRGLSHAEKGDESYFQVVRLSFGYKF